MVVTSAFCVVVCVRIVPRWRWVRCAVVVHDVFIVQFEGLKCGERCKKLVCRIMAELKNDCFCWNCVSNVVITCGSCGSCCGGVFIRKQQVSEF